MQDSCMASRPVGTLDIAPMRGIKLKKRHFTLMCSQFVFDKVMLYWL